MWGGFMKVLINYANKTYRKAQKLNTWTGKHIAGFDKVIEYSPDDVDSDFRRAYHDIFSYQRGNGLWLWKPYFLCKTLDSLRDGDILFYADSGTFWIRKAKPIFDIIEKEDIFVSSIPLIERQFTKRYVFEQMGMNYAEYGETNQIQATMIGVKKTGTMMEFSKQWLDYCCQIDLISPDSCLEESEKMISHREDQSILSLLCKKKGILVHKDPTQCGRVPEQYKCSDYTFQNVESVDDYPPIMVVHRSAKAEITCCLNQYLKCILPRRISLRFMKNGFE